MTTESPPSTIAVALIGNPNTGKSTLFNALCGVRQRVGNYPGVTVEKKIGTASFHGTDFTVIDLPGSYSLAPRSPDEMIAVDVILGHREEVASPNVVLCIVDASNLERNLYLVSQVLEFGKPTVIALNMIDVLRQRGMTIDREALSRRLGVPIVEIQANRAVGLAELKAALAEAAGGKRFQPPASPFPQAFQDELTKLEEAFSAAGAKPPERCLVERLLLDTSGYVSAAMPGVNDSILQQVTAARERLTAGGNPVPAVEAISRYQWIAASLDGVVHHPKERLPTPSDKLDRFLTHWLWGTATFVVVMILMFQAVFYIAEPASYAIDTMTSVAANFVSANVGEGALRSLLINGVIEGVGGVLVFLPQIFVLFLFIAILEDCGYMARAAHLMDRLMWPIGLNGKSFIPLLSSFACAIPGIMAARVIENPRDRLVTILVAPLMSCSARLPVYTLLIAAFIPNVSFVEIGNVTVFGLQGLTMFAMYMVGIVAAVVVTLALRNTILRGAPPPFVMELPGYKVPGISIVVHRMLSQGWHFVRRAGTLIFAVTVIVWAAAYYPRDEQQIDPALLTAKATMEASLSADSTPENADQLEQQLAEIDNRIAGLHLENSFLGRAGHFIEPVVKPLGWDWRIGCAAIASFPAREVVIASLGVIYNLGEDEDEESQALRETLHEATWSGTNRKVFTVPVALSIMVFFALCAQCASTLAVMKRETNSWRWPVFTFVYMTGLAYVSALVTYQVGTWLVA